MSQENFKIIFDRLSYLQNRELFVFDGYACADPNYSYPLRFINELAWQNIFVQQLFLKKEPASQTEHKPNFTIIVAPGFQADPITDMTNSEAFIIINFSRMLILIGGTHYAGEIKKSVFSALNYLLPKRNVLSMHCSANVEKRAMWHGLSELARLPFPRIRRFLIGDDERLV